MPEWYMVNIVLLVLSMLGILWKPLLVVLPLLVVTTGGALFKCYQKYDRSLVYN